MKINDILLVGGLLVVGYIAYQMVGGSLNLGFDLGGGTNDAIPLEGEDETPTSLSGAFQ